MTIEQSLTTYTVAAAILTLTPGVDTALVLRASTVEGWKSATGGALGIAVGLLIWGAVVAVGLGGLLAASAFAYTALRFLGAAYLFYLGLKLIFKPRNSLTQEVMERAPQTLGAWFWKGLVNNLLNPKIGVFYVTFLPQFVPDHVSVSGWTFLLAAYHSAMVLTWFAVLIGASTPLSKFLRQPRVVRSLDRLTGGVFVAFGAKLALSSR